MFASPPNDQEFTKLETYTQELYNGLVNPEKSDKVTWIFVVHALASPDALQTELNSAIPNLAQSKTEEPYAILSPWLTYSDLEYMPIENFEAQLFDLAKPPPSANCRKVSGILWRAIPMCFKSRANLLGGNPVPQLFCQLAKTWLEQLPRDCHPANQFPLQQYLHLWYYLDWMAALLQAACDTTTSTVVMRNMIVDQNSALFQSFSKRCADKCFLPNSRTSLTSVLTQDLTAPQHPFWRVAAACLEDWLTNELSATSVHNPNLKFEYLEWNFCVFTRGTVLEAVFNGGGVVPQGEHRRPFATLQNTVTPLKIWAFWSFKHLNDAFCVSKQLALEKPNFYKWRWTESLAATLQQQFGVFVAKLAVPNNWTKLENVAAETEELHFLEFRPTEKLDERRENMWRFLGRLHTSVSVASLAGNYTKYDESMRKLNLHGFGFDTLTHPFVRWNAGTSLADFRKHNHPDQPFPFTPLAIWQLKMGPADSYKKNHAFALFLQSLQAASVQRLQTLAKCWFEKELVEIPNHGTWFVDISLLQTTKNILKNLQTEKVQLVLTMAPPSNPAGCLDLRRKSQGDPHGTNLYDVWLNQILETPTLSPVIVWPFDNFELSDSESLELLQSLPLAVCQQTHRTLSIVYFPIRNPNLVELFLLDGLEKRLAPPPVPGQASAVPSVPPHSKQPFALYLQSWLHINVPMFVKQQQTNLLGKIIGKFFDQFPGVVLKRPPTPAARQQPTNNKLLNITVFAGNHISTFDVYPLLKNCKPETQTALTVRFVWDPKTSPTVWSLFEILHHPNLQHITMDKICIEFDCVGVMNVPDESQEMAQKLTRHLLAQLASQSFVSS